MSNNLQIRIRTDQGFNDIMVIKSWLDEATHGFAFQHPKEGNNHYHIYLFEFSKQPDGLRKTLGNYYKKVEYSVKTTAGKTKDKIIPILAWQYGTEDVLRTPVWVKGFTEENIESFQINAKEYYESMKKELGPLTLVTKHDHYVVRPDRVWEKLYAKQADYKHLSLAQIKSKIATEWLNAGKAMPRPSDLHRYATSLKWINKYSGKEIPEFALQEEWDEDVKGLHVRFK